MLILNKCDLATEEELSKLEKHYMRCNRKPN
ncbi:hypothetical protein [Paenibacillus sp. DCT19]|nr:hypothetical protein [Paenibacillus sp. DCT19]